MRYRILLMLSAIYRLWAKVRLRHVAGWIDSWQMEEIHAGGPGKGAETAWWDLAAMMEQHIACGEGLQLASFDLGKAVDMGQP